MVIHSVQRPPNVEEIIFGAEGYIVGRQDIVICHGGELKVNKANRFDTISVTHRSYDPLA